METNGGNVRSISNSQHEILEWIRTLHCPDGFECDVTYGHGSFWSQSTPPPLRFDIAPQVPDVVQANSESLPLRDGSLRNVVFDPPFLTYVKNGREHKNGGVALTSRFGGYYTYGELLSHYSNTITELWRVLAPGGKLIFKCQDIIHNHRMHSTHSKVIHMAELQGFFLRDLFVLLARSRMPGPQKGTQRHARIWHSYFLVLEKPPQKRSR